MRTRGRTAYAELHRVLVVLVRITVKKASQNPAELTKYQRFVIRSSTFSSMVDNLRIHGHAGKWAYAKLHPSQPFVQVMF